MKNAIVEGLIDKTIRQNNKEAQQMGIPQPGRVWIFSKRLHLSSKEEMFYKNYFLYGQIKKVLLVSSKGIDQPP